MKRNKLILFDLENTLIWDWIENRGLVSMSFPQLGQWIEDQGEFTAGLFSFAVWDKDDLNEFNTSGMREDIEEHHHFKFDDEWIFLRDSLVEPFKKILKMPFLDKHDLFSFFNKHMILERLWLENLVCDSCKDMDVILLDDTVKDLTITHENSSLTFVNPWTIIHNN
jgi:hypothetical protein